MRGTWTMLVIVLLAVVLTVGASVFTYAKVREFVADSPISLPPPPQPGGSGQPTTVPLMALNPTATTGVPQSPTSAATQDAIATQNAAASKVTAAPTVSTLSDPGRVTILVLGIDQRKGEKGPFRTDTIMVLSVDPIRKTAAMLSIPRDIYMTIPGYGKADRINNANVIGESVINYPGGGPALAVKTVQSLLGVPIQRYVMVNFDVFTAVIDALGAVTVCPSDPIHDDHYPDGSYGFITVDFPAGCQDLDATKLLQYSRVRHNAGDDFGRAQRQQEVVRSVREKVLSLGGVSALLGKAGEIWTAIKDNIKTDMTFDEMVALAQIAQTIPKENIHSAVITDKDSSVIPTNMANGDSVLQPVYERIHNLVELLFDPTPGGGVVNPQASDEGAVIIVSNGAGIDGLGKSTTDRLREQGFTIADTKNADQPGGYGKSVIRVYTGKIKTARYLAEVLGLDGTAIVTETNGPAGVDIELVVGKDLAPSNK